MAHGSNLFRVELPLVVAVFFVLSNGPVQSVKQLGGRCRSPLAAFAILCLASTPLVIFCRALNGTDCHYDETGRSDLGEELSVTGRTIGATAVAPQNDRQLDVLAERGKVLGAVDGVRRQG